MTWRAVRRGPARPPTPGRTAARSPVRSRPAWPACQGWPGSTPAAVEVATQYAGGKVPGVAVRPDRIVVRVVLDRLPVAPVAGHAHMVVQTVLKAVGLSRPVELVVADVELDSLPGCPADAAGPTERDAGREAAW